MNAKALPDDLCELLRGFPSVDSREQAFPFVTVDTGGYPHSALLSRSELEPGPEGLSLFVVVAGRVTRANLKRTGAASLLAAHGTACHHAKLRMTRSVTERGLMGCVFTVTEYRHDDIGIALQPMSFQTSERLAQQENWQRSTAMLSALSAAHPRQATFDDR
ncbi:hypothetical protein [Mycobacteroides sp. LB1]|uniref:hypothetical protein n=1 Tax=Mycobacteroides sp. LB1 TaxID=2750814 RepID=UPI0015DD7F5F|nr:hypothetical protein [Mycobacteroides sp. LB1]